MADLALVAGSACVPGCALVTLLGSLPVMADWGVGCAGIGADLVQAGVVEGDARDR
jgi:hypothetical protein